MTSTRSPTPPEQRTPTGRSRHPCGNQPGIPDHTRKTNLPTSIDYRLGHGEQSA
jgi:hypothetical protein